MTLAPKKFRKKPVVIEAVLLAAPLGDGIGIVQQRVIHWMRAHDVRACAHPEGVTIPTLEGEMLASFGDYIIKGVQGEFYPCKPDIFAATYELVEDDDESGTEDSAGPTR